jgi:glutamate-1-semialdehyde 2,1-aminomutase
VSANEALFTRARALFPGGVNSPVRAFGAVGGTPRFITRAEGAYVWDADGRRLLDYVASWGAILLGHAHPAVVEAIREAAGKGTSYGAPTEREIALAERIRAAFPSIEKVRFTSSGTEALMSAIRLARAATERDKILKFAGGYHGHADALLAQAGSGLATMGLPASAGVPAAATRDTLVAPYNDVEAVGRAFEAFPRDIAAVVVEPIAANMGVVLPREGFLESLREMTRGHGALLVFDEVITGFRVARGGAQQLFGITPDLTCLGKVIGGGLPVGAFGGRDGLMDMIAPEGPVYQAGTLSGNPLAMAAGAAALDALAAPGVYERIEATARRLAEGLVTLVGPRAAVVQQGALLTLFFASPTAPHVPTHSLGAPPADYEAVRNADSEAFRRFFHAMLARGILLPPSPFEAWFTTLAHGDEEVDLTLEAARFALAEALG